MNIPMTVGTAWLLVLLAGTNSCIGNLMLKKSRLVAQSGDFLHLVLSPWFIGGLLFYGVNVLFFAKALDRLPVSLAYPVAAGVNFALLVASASWLYQEHLNLSQYGGLLAIVLGMFLLAR